MTKSATVVIAFAVAQLLPSVNWSRVAASADGGGLLGSSLMLNMIRVWGPELLKQVPKRRDARSADGGRAASSSDFSLADSLAEMQPHLLGLDPNSLTPALAMFREAPEIVLPMLVRYAQSIGSHPDCIKRTVCEANQRVVERFGLVGHVLGTIGSEFVISAMTGSSGNVYEYATEGGKAGREGYDCHKEFPDCENLPGNLYD